LFALSEQTKLHISAQAEMGSPPFRALYVGKADMTRFACPLFVGIAPERDRKLAPAI
jgi:hypothetical protein